MTDKGASHRAYIGLGSNLDEPIEQIKRAMGELARLTKSRVVHCSRLYKSKPMGPQGQADFINAVVELHTTLKPAKLLLELQALERQHQRGHGGPRWGPRTLDLDILLYGDTIMHETDLDIPHPGMHERDFVLYPLYDINPDIKIPGRGDIKTLMRQCPDYGVQAIQI